MSCRIDFGCKMLISAHQCMRYSFNKNKEIFMCRRYNTFAKSLRPVSLVKLSHLTVNDRTIRYEHDRSQAVLRRHQFLVPLACNLHSNDSQKPRTDQSESQEKSEVKLSLYQKFKKMYKEYWYVLLPVHLITSCFWFGSFYYMAARSVLQNNQASQQNGHNWPVVQQPGQNIGNPRFCLALYKPLNGSSFISFSGINIPEILEALGAPESWIEKLKNSKTGNLVLAYTLYKVATPVRYTVTVGGTTISINYLKKLGWIKPVPNKEQIKKLYQEQKCHFKDLKVAYQDKMQVTKNEYLKTKNDIKKHFKEAKEEVHDSMVEMRYEFKDVVDRGAEESKFLWRVFSKDAKNFGNNVKEGLRIKKKGSD